MSEIKSFKLKNKYVFSLASWLTSLSLIGKESRERSKFLEILNQRVRENEVSRLEILKRYAKQDEKGNLLVKKDEAIGREVYDIPEEVLAAYEKEYLDLQEEELIIDLLEGNKEKFKSVKNTVLNTDYKFGPSENDNAIMRQLKIEQSSHYSEWCNAFEKVEI